MSDVVVLGHVPERRAPEHGAVGRVHRGRARTERVPNEARAAGFADVVEPRRVYKVEDARSFLSGKGSTSTHRARGRRQIHERVRAREKTRPRPGDRPAPAAPRAAAPEVETMSDAQRNGPFLCTGNSARSPGASVHS